MIADTAPEISTAVSKAISSFPKIDILMFYLKIEKGMSTKEIAEIADLRVDHVNKRLKKMYLSVRKEMVI